MSALAPARATFAAAPRACARASRRGARLGDPRLGSLAVAHFNKNDNPRLVRRRRLLGPSDGRLRSHADLVSRRSSSSCHGGSEGRPRRPRNRTGRTHDPYSTPLRDANRDRLYGFLTARAAWTLLTYLTEINKAGASFFSEYMANNPIPYHYGAEAKIVDVSGESFILGLMTMTPVNIDEKFRNNYITVDPPALAVRLLDIRLALHDEFVADLSHVREENADIMKVACLSNLEGSMRWSATSR